MKNTVLIAVFSLFFVGCSSIQSVPKPSRDFVSTEQAQERFEALPQQYKVEGGTLLTRLRVHHGFNGFTTIDRRSLILHSGASKRYLVVLEDDARALAFTQQIYLTNDLHLGTEYIGGERIQAIIELDGRSHASDVRDAISNH